MVVLTAIEEMAVQRSLTHSLAEHTCTHSALDTPPPNGDYFMVQHREGWSKSSKHLLNEHSLQSAAPTLVSG